MSEQLTVLFERLRGSQPPTPFAAPAQVRRRGRQRTHRQALAAGSAVLAVAGLGTGWALGTVDGSPTPPALSPSSPSSSSPSSSSPSSSPSRPATVTPRFTVAPRSVEASRLLEPEDFPVGGLHTSELEDQGPDGPEWPWVSVVGGCPEYRAEDYPTVANRHDARGLMYSDTSWYAWETVESYPDAAANLADVREAIATCPAYQYPGGVEIQQTVVAEQFAGDDSLLVRVRRGASTDYMVVVRVGGLVATVMYSQGPEADARDLATAMAARLR
ncbi:hypothetical protein RB614_43320 [Phytohabitans sp. ZYX-F-186]|uniref:PknH-like extracellular domain-containing protein n=1 Tax=Phytohabitans maris TaxID=3071409 RepID=A0ABU0ZXU6_9ACTN|nr:hypothetical protein [Phytohabitans sp. ZYX-F-186]MDQ7911342.1 hypothetical protein [Phytohabitans sp. ZYX-F-186]